LAARIGLHNVNRVDDHAEAVPEINDVTLIAGPSAR